MQALAERGQSPARRRGGFTLIEVMIAVAILGFGLLTMAVMQLTAMNGGRAGRHTTQAAVVARNQMEIFQRLAWTDPGIVATAGWTAPVVVTTTPTGAAAAEQTYNVTWRITDLDPNWIKNVDIRITWNEPRFANKTLTISGVRYNDPW